MPEHKILRKGLARISDLQDFQSPKPDLFVDTVLGSDGNDGLSWESALDTMGAALAKALTGNRIFFRGDVREELTGSNLKFDIKIIGVGGLHHPDLPSSAYHPGAAMWRPPASPTTATNLLVVRGRGWEFHNIAFDCPVDAAAVQLSRNALSDVSEYDASHAVFYNCRFLSGKYGIDDAGGANHVIVESCEFAGMTTAGIFGSSTAVANPRAWQIKDCFFPADVSSLGNATHIDASLNESLIVGSFFGTVLSTAKYIDLTGGNGNIVTRNLLMGAYDTSDYVPGTGDTWAGNQSLSASFGGNDAQGRTLSVPAAAT